MPFLDLTAEYDPEVKTYRQPLETFSHILEMDELGGLPEPKGKIGPIRSVRMSRAVREDGAEVLGRVMDHVIYLLKGDPYREPELRYNFNLLLLMDVFGMNEEDADKYEPELDELIW